jgi:hypothetical protein
MINRRPNAPLTSLAVAVFHSRVAGHENPQAAIVAGCAPTPPGLMAWRSVPAEVRREVLVAARHGRPAQDARVSAAAVAYANTRSQHLARAGLVARIAAWTFFVLSGLTRFNVIPPLVDLHPASGSVRDYVSWWLWGLVLAGFGADRLIRRRRQRLETLASANQARANRPA